VQKVLESDRHLAVDIGPRVTGTPQEREAAEHFGKLTSYGFEVTYQNWAAGTTPDQTEEYAAGASGLLNQGNGNYQFNWKTPKT